MLIFEIMAETLQFIFKRIYELLNRKTFDSYRVSVHNPLTIFSELAISIDKYNKKKVKHFDPTVTTIGEEARELIKYEFIDTVFSFGEFSKKQVENILEETCIKKKDGKKNRTLLLLCKTIEIANVDFKNQLIIEIENITNANNPDSYGKLEVLSGWLVSQLLYQGYSRKFISDRFHKCETSILHSTSQEGFAKLKATFTKANADYHILFKVRSSQGIKLIPSSVTITEEESFPTEFQENKYINSKFKEKSDGESYFFVHVQSLDFWSALRKAHRIISETLEINTLNESEIEFLLDPRALAIHDISRHCRIQIIEELLDGAYEKNEANFTKFMSNYKSLPEGSVAKEKLRSAIKFYKLGNDSLEIEHKVLNYWIGFEQLFSSVDTDEDSIKRIKAFFITLNASFYFQRRIGYLKTSVDRCGVTLDTNELITDNPIPSNFVLIINRLNRYKLWVEDNKQISSILHAHMNRLSQHITRIYRVRNELVHEGRSESIPLQLIAGHLKHYLLFSIEQLTNELNSNPAVQHLDDVFVYFENLVDRVLKADSVREILLMKPYEGFIE